MDTVKVRLCTCVMVLGSLLIHQEAIAESRDWDAGKRQMQRLAAVQDYCETNYNDPQCTKYISRKVGALFREIPCSEDPYQDVCSETKEKRSNRLLEREALQELKTFCRDNPDSQRCESTEIQEKLESKRGFSY